jgi:colicin import membrane protein
MTISLVGHGLVLVWALVSFARPLETKQLETFPVDVLTTEEFSKITAGTEKAQKKETSKPVVEKIAEAKPAEDLSAKVVEKKEVKAATEETNPEPAPKKPDPKPAAAPPEPKTETKAADKKDPEQKVDPIAEALKKDDAKKPDKKAEAKPQPVKKPDPQPPKFDPRATQALLSKLDPTRVAAAGAALNTTASLGAPRGFEPALSASEIDAIRRRVSNNWNKQESFATSDIVLDIDLDLRVDGAIERLEVKTRGRGSLYDAVRDSATRAIMASAPFDMLSRTRYQNWKRLQLTFKAGDFQ